MNPWRKDKTPIQERLRLKSVANPVTGCLEWQGCHNELNYGLIYFGKAWYVHRLAWTLRHGHIPDGLCVCHGCDNPKCFNVDHLFLGTKKDNMRDCVNKGRIQNQKGVANNKAKLNEKKVLQIRSLRANGVLCRVIAKRFKLHETTVSQIALKQTWNFV